jgi:hypothetical protein
MKNKGITYDIGTEYIPGTLSRTGLSADLIKSDMNAIKNDLFCNSIRIYGKERDNLILAADIALETGLNVWLSPRLINNDIQSTLPYLGKVSIDFEKLRLKYPTRELVIMVGGEISIDMKGFVKGNIIHERISNLLKPFFFLKNALVIKPPFQKSFDAFLSDAVTTIKKHFYGKVTYASASWENVDWSIFDIVSINLYKADYNKSFFIKILRKMNSKGKPLAITEFGCCTYIGADKKGASGYSILEQSSVPPVFKEKCERSEKVQADYILDLLQTFDKEKVDTTFIFDFYMQKLTHSSNPDLDYDKISFGITKSAGDNKWEPKESFYIISDYYKNK